MDPTSHTHTHVRTHARVCARVCTPWVPRPLSEIVTLCWSCGRTTTRVESQGQTLRVLGTPSSRRVPQASPGSVTRSRVNVSMELGDTDSIFSTKEEVPLPQVKIIMKEFHSVS